MSQDNLIRLVSTKSPHVYWSRRKKKAQAKKGGGAPQPLTLKKYDPTLKKHVLYKEKKK
ncbi:MAG: 50S ribosomal protein L33 [Candidatus Campbellbacteria bacterium]|nr:50S ribosomal protein L33 [Candidatus Campbellbacteria bacterium]